MVQTSTSGGSYMHRTSAFLVILVAALLGIVSVVSAQVATGNIVGRVTDASGALVADVEVTAINRRHRRDQPRDTDEEGIYRLMYLAPASYN